MNTMADQWPAKPRLSGTVVDRTGSPAPAAKIWLLGNLRRGESSVIPMTQADAAGRFALDDPRSEGIPLPLSGLVARDCFGCLGGIELPPLGDSAGQEIHIPLVDVRDYHGRLADAEGGPVANVLLRPDTLVLVLPGTVTKRRVVGVPSEVAAELSGQTADDGSFVLRGVPIQGNIGAGVIAPDLRSTSVMWDLCKPVTIYVGRAGSVTGRLTGDDPATVAGVAMRLSNAFAPEESPNPDYTLTHHQETHSDSDGSFEFLGVPPGTYRVGVARDERSLYAAFDSPRFRVKPGEQATVVLSLCRLITVRGKVTDHQTKTGVLGVGLHFYTRSTDRENIWPQETKTDAQGDYSVRMLPGRVCGYVESCPEEYTVPDPGPGLRRAPLNNDATWPVIELEQGTSVEGIVVDESGQPVADAEVSTCRAAGRRVETLKCDRMGKFVVRQISTTGELRIVARTESAATTEPLVILPAQAKEPVRLVLSQGSAGALRGEVADEAGQAVPYASVSVNGYWRFGARRDGFQVASLRCDHGGRFEVHGLWPDEDYRLQVLAEGFEVREEISATPRKAETLDLGRIVLDGARGAIEGSVVDSGGNPVPGVRVFNSGDAPKRLSVSTNAAGRFRLSGFCAGAAFVFAEKQGHRFQDVLTRSGDARVKIVLLRNDEALPPQLPPPRWSEDEQHALIRPIVERLGELGEQVKTRVAFFMAFLDPLKAQQWAEELGSPYHHEFAQAAAAMRWATTDLDAALAMLPVGSRASVDMLKILAEQFNDENPDKALRCAEERLARAGELTSSERAEVLAWTGGWMARLGRQQSAERLSLEAAEVAANLSAASHPTRIRGEVAARVATFDLQRAVALLEPLGVRDNRSYWLARVAAAASINHPGEARALWNEVGPIHQNDVRVWTACRLAETCPADAMQLVETLDGDDAGLHKVTAFGWISETVAPRDLALACSLIDRALKLAMETTTGMCSRPYEEMPAQAALQAVHAQRIGYPDFPSVVARVLAARHPLAPFPQWAFQGSLRQALVLALADPEAAGRLLRVLEPRCARLSATETGGRTRIEWLKAWALADPRYAVELARRELDAVSKPPDRDIERSGVLEVVSLLGLPKSECLRLLGGRVSVTPPGQ